jgi:hypothetical protein
VEVRELVIAGWTGRDERSLRKHIRELEELGVKLPKTTPIFYRVSANLLTTGSEIQVSGADTSGEVEFVLLQGSELRVALGSDHTDRKAETIGVSLSKQLCAKPVSRESWRYDEVKPHWERLMLRSWTDGKLYQEGPVTAIRSPEDLMSRYPLKPGYAMFCSTLAAKDGIRGGARFTMELEDPVLKRKLSHEYRVKVLPVEG